MFDVIAGWFVLGMFVAGVWIIVGAAATRDRRGPTAETIACDVPRGRNP